MASGAASDTPAAAGGAEAGMLAAADSGTTCIWTCFLAKSLAGFEPMQSLDQNGPAIVEPNENGGLLSDF